MHADVKLVHVEYNKILYVDGVLRPYLRGVFFLADEAIALERLHRTRVRGRRKPTRGVDIGSREARHHRRFNTSVCKWLADKVARFSRF